VAYALGHRTRIEILLLLNEGTYTTTQLADLLDRPLNNVAGHVRELLDAGSIEVADTKRRRNTLQSLLRAVQQLNYSEEEIETMPVQERQVTFGLIIQSMVAEVLAALWAEKISKDPRTSLAWNWLNLDAQGREEMKDEQERSWRRLAEIEADSLNRTAESGEETTSYIVGQLGFERARKAPEPPRSADGE
jgi:DNA-binding transcriptional ArsR family regulator